MKQAEELKLEPAVFTFDNSETGTRLPKVNADENIISAEQKLSMLKDMGVKTVYSPDFSEVRDLSPEMFIDEILVKKLSAAAVCCGYDFRFGKNGCGDAEVLKKLCGERRIKLTVIPAVSVDGKTVSSSVIRSLIREGGIKNANTLLGYELNYILPVLHGEQLGRKLGAPTVNQRLPAGNVYPRFGVYKSRAVVSGKSYPSVTNIGLRPTVDENSAIPLMETHIIGYENDDFKPEVSTERGILPAVSRLRGPHHLKEAGEIPRTLYGASVRIFLLDFIRDEKKYNGVNELKEQIKKDIEISLSALV